MVRGMDTRVFFSRPKVETDTMSPYQKEYLSSFLHQKQDKERLLDQVVSLQKVKEMDQNFSSRQFFCINPASASLM